MESHNYVMHAYLRRGTIGLISIDILFLAQWFFAIASGLKFNFF